MNTIGKLTSEWAQAHGLPCFYMAETNSTNLVAKSFGMDPAFERLLFVADHQTHGRGRGDHTWSNAHRGEQLLASFVYYKQQKFQHTTAQLFGLALYAAAKACYPALPWGLKAPNDLYLGRAKVAGILVDIVTGGPLEQLVVGVGLNVMGHPEQVTTATHLLAHQPQALQNWPEFLTRMTENFTWAAEQALLPRIDFETQSRLLEALNSYALLPEPYTDVDSDGNLTTATRHIRWTDL